MSPSPRHLALLVLVLAALVMPAAAQVPKDKPRVPPGLDPGGVAIAVIGSGVDYTRPEIAARLARDGEGQLIGWDFVDNDHRPIGDCRTGPGAPPCPMAAVRTILREALQSRFVVVRASQDTTALIRAVQFAARTPARIGVFALEGITAPRSLFLSSAADHFPDVLFIAPVIADGGSPGVIAPRPNLIQVADVSQLNGPDTADVIVPANVTPATATGDGPVAAAARIAALAARILAMQPGLRPLEIKQRIIALAKPAPSDVKATSRYGWIAQPHAD